MISTSITPSASLLKRLSSHALSILLICAMAAFLFRQRPAIGGVDFYYFLCTARDFLHHVPDPAFTRYIYFPGGFRVWEFIIAVFGNSFATAQWAVASLLFANALLVGAIAYRRSGELVFGACAATLYVVMISRLEGLSGTTEPIATLFALIGLAVWDGNEVSTHHRWRLIILGLTLGIAVWTKQQAGLISLGALFFVSRLWPSPPIKRDTLTVLLCIPVFAILSFLGLILCEGHGLLPLSVAINWAIDYTGQGSWTENIRLLIQRLGLPWHYFIAAIAVWLYGVIRGRKRTLNQKQTLSIAGFSVLAALATLIQFSRRPYAHYALLSAPFIALAITLTLHALVETTSVHWKMNKQKLWAITILVLLLPACGASQNSSFSLWALAAPMHMTPYKGWETDIHISNDIAILRKHIKTDEEVLILPPRRNVIHYLLGSRSPSYPSGYGWGWADPLLATQSGSLRAVLVVDPVTFDNADRWTCETFGCERSPEKLTSAGFKPVLSLDTMTLWRR